MEDSEDHHLRSSPLILVSQAGPNITIRQVSEGHVIAYVVFTGSLPDRLFFGVSKEPFSLKITGGLLDLHVIENLYPTIRGRDGAMRCGFRIAFSSAGR